MKNGTLIVIILAVALIGFFAYQVGKDNGSPEFIKEIQHEMDEVGDHMESTKDDMSIDLNLNKKIKLD